MALAEVLDDLVELQGLAAVESDPARRRSLDEVRTHVARRERGAKISEAAEVLGLSQPTVRVWLETGVLAMVPDTKPIRIDVLSIADVRHALDLIRAHADDRQLLIRVMRILRDRAALDGSAEGLADLQGGHVVPLGDDLADEIRELRREKKPRSTSH